MARVARGLKGPGRGLVPLLRRFPCRATVGSQYTTPAMAMLCLTAALKSVNPPHRGIHNQREKNGLSGAQTVNEQKLL
jgi:hypothetical protein